MAVIEKTRNNCCWRGCGEEGTCVQCWWDLSWCGPYRKRCGSSSSFFFKKPPYHPALPLVGVHLKMKALIREDLRTSMFTAALFTMQCNTMQCRDREAMDEWIKKMWYLYSGMLFGHKKEKPCHLGQHAWNFRALRYME